MKKKPKRKKLIKRFKNSKRVWSKNKCKIKAHQNSKIITSPKNLTNKLAKLVRIKR